MTMLNKTNTVAEAAPQPKPLFGQSLDALTHLMAGFGQRPYRANQLIEAVYRQRVTTLDEITTLPASLRESLAAEGYTIDLPEIVQTARSVDGTERYLIRMTDGETVETVWMPEATVENGATAPSPPKKKRRKTRPAIQLSPTAAPPSASPARSDAPSTASSVSRPS
jgi:Predicted Fe-S-cluster redox enzyme